MKHLTTNEITTIVKAQRNIAALSFLQVYNDKLTNGRRKLKVMSNGRRWPTKMKNVVLKDLNAHFENSNVESITVESSESWRGGYDFLRIVKID